MLTTVFLLQVPPLLHSGTLGFPLNHAGTTSFGFIIHAITFHLRLVHGFRSLVMSPTPFPADVTSSSPLASHSAAADSQVFLPLLFFFVP